MKVFKIYSFEEENLIERELCELFPAEWLGNKARETGLIKRERKIDPVVIFWVLAIGYGTFFQRTLAGLKRNYERASKQILRDSSWYYRFTPEIVAFLHECVARGMEYMSQEPRWKIDGLNQLKESSIIPTREFSMHPMIM